MIFDRLRALGESVLNSGETAKVAKEAAIVAYENDPKRNSAKHIIVRGSNGIPVEVIMKNKSQAAFVVNGKETNPFDVGKLTGGSFSDPIPELCLSGDLSQAYEIESVHRLDYGEKKAVYVLAGVALGGPPGLVVRS